MGLAENAAQGSYGNLVFLWRDGGIDGLSRASRKLDVAALLPDFDEAAASSRRLTSRKGWGLSRPNLGLDHADLGWTGCLGRFEVQFERFLEVGKSLFLGLALAGNVDFQALGDVPLPLTPNGGSEWSLHEPIVSQAGVRRTVARAPPG